MPQDLVDEGDVKTTVTDISGWNWGRIQRDNTPHTPYNKNLTIEMKNRINSQWTHKMLDEHPGYRDKTPVEEVQSVTEPIGQELASTLIEGMLKELGPYGLRASTALPAIGLLVDILGSPDEAW